jgi:hypothetical protein
MMMMYDDDKGKKDDRFGNSVSYKNRLQNPEVFSIHQYLTHSKIKM